MKSEIMEKDPYEVLAVPKSSSIEEIKIAYRLLAKKHHPDRGGDPKRIIEINQAWEVLKNRDLLYRNKESQKIYSKEKSHEFKSNQNQSSNNDKSISLWMKYVYLPIDEILEEIIQPFPQKIKDLSGDPYDNKLMGDFCEYIKRSQNKIKKAQEIYQSIATPLQIRSFSLALYQCFSEIEDGINELERYSAGYVESYLHDGNEMIRQAKKNRILLHQTKKQLTVN